jgi:hypothetical protein
MSIKQQSAMAPRPRLQAPRPAAGSPGRKQARVALPSSLSGLTGFPGFPGPFSPYYILKKNSDFQISLRSYERRNRFRMVHGSLSGLSASLKWVGGGLSAVQSGSGRYGGEGGGGKPVQDGSWFRVRYGAPIAPGPAPSAPGQAGPIGVDRAAKAPTTPPRAHPALPGKVSDSLPKARPFSPKTQMRPVEYPIGLLMADLEKHRSRMWNRPKPQGLVVACNSTTKAAACFVRTAEPYLTLCAISIFCLEEGKMFRKTGYANDWPVSFLRTLIKDSASTIIQSTRAGG